MVELDHLLHVHPVDMVRAEDRNQIGVVILEQVEVLKNGIGGALVPALAHPHLGRNRSDKLVIQYSAELPSIFKVLDQRLGAPLNQDVNRVNSRIHQIGEDEIDDPVLPAKRHCRFGALAGQRMQPAAEPSGHYHRKRPHCPTLGVLLQARLICRSFCDHSVPSHSLVELAAQKSRRSKMSRQARHCGSFCQKVERIVAKKDQCAKVSRS